MGTYLMIASRDPFDSIEATRAYELARGVARHGNDVTVFLVQNGVLAAREATSAAADVRALASQVTVLADEFSLSERGIGTDELLLGITPADIDDLIELLTADGCVAWWH